MWITKVDAARRQLKTAIELWFGDGDPVSIHTLAHASHEIIHRLYRLQGLSGLMFDAPGLKGKGAALFKESANFFKHAKIEHDPGAKIQFVPAINDLYLIMSVIGLQRMKVRLNEIELAFLVYFCLHNRGLCGQSVEKSIPSERLDQLIEVDQHQFLEAFRKFRRHRHAGA